MALSEGAALAIGLGSTLIGTAGNIAATNNLNGRNRRWQTQMWEKTNEYNTPSAQKARLEAAGINPYSVLGSQSADTGQASQSSTPQTFQPNLDAMNNVGENILGSINMARQNEILDQQKEMGRVNLEFARMEKLAGLQKLYAEIGNLLEQKNLTHTEREMLERQYYILGETMNSIIQGRYYEAEQGRIKSQNLQREYDDAHLESVLKRMSLDAGIRVSRAQLGVMAQDIQESLSRISLNASQASLNYEQVRTEIQKQATEICNRVISRQQNQRGWNDMYVGITKTMFDMWDATRGLEVPFGKFKLAQPGATYDIFKAMDLPYSMPHTK